MTQRICTYPCCGKPARTRGWCRQHYRAWSKYGDPGGPPPVLDLPGEIWLPVVRWEEFYRVSSCGRIKSLARIDALGRAQPERILKPYIHPKDGYARIKFAANGTVTNPTPVHQIVAEAFLGPCPPGQEVCHNDGNPANCTPGNLRYDTHSANLRDKRQHGTDHNVNKAKCPQGHDYTPENTYISPASSSRVCRECWR